MEKFDTLSISQSDKAEGCPFISFKEKKIYFAATLDTSEYKGKKTPPLQIFECSMKNFSFDPLSFSKRTLVKNIIVAEQWQSMPFVSRNGKVLLFCASTDSTKTDIWYTKRKNIRQEWSNPQPLKAINTKYSDTHPVMSKNSKYLYFSSDRPNPNGFGGYDIYRVKKLRNGKYTEPELLKSPINSFFNDKQFVPIKKKYAYFTSDRANGKRFDIYWIDINKKGNYLPTWKITQKQLICLNC